VNSNSLGWAVGVMVGLGLWLLSTSLHIEAWTLAVLCGFTGGYFGPLLMDLFR
jgi:hypothetical protein